MRWKPFLAVLIAAVGGGVCGMMGASASTAFAATVPRFSAPVRVPLDSPTAVVAGDFDGDGMADLATAEDKTVAVSLSRGDGSFRPPVVSRTLRGSWDIATADVDPDGRPDLITASIDAGSNAIAVLRNDGAGHFHRIAVYRQRGGAEAVVSGDVNGDGTADLVATDTGASLTPTVLLGLGAGRFAAAAPSPHREVAEDLALADLNGDGRTDLAVVDQVSLLIRLGNGDGTFGITRTYEAGDTPRAVALADLNFDAKLDAVVAAETDSDDAGSLSVFLGNGDGSFRARSDSSYDGDASAVLVADLNADGAPDIITTESVGRRESESERVGRGPAVRNGHGNGVFEAPHRLPGHFDLGGTVGDFNRDGRPDLAFVKAFGYRPESVEVYLNWTGLPAAPCVVHSFRHQRLHNAIRDLRRSGCRLGQVRHRRTRRPGPRRVISQQPAGGAVLPGASRVDLLVTRGRRR
jgi:hypothetical protein